MFLKKNQINRLLYVQAELCLNLHIDGAIGFWYAMRF